MIRHAYGFCAALAGLGALAGCNIDKLAAEFHVKEETTGTTSAETSTSSGGQEASSSGGGSSGSASAGASTTGGETTMPASESTADSSSGPPPGFCGDGVVEGEEECDDGNEEDVDGCSNDCARAWTIFVTSDEMFTGKINGLEGADNRCRNAALNAPLPRGLQYTALLSDSTTDAAARVHHARGWYRLVNGLPVARGWEGLMTGPLMNAVNVNEKSETADTMVWTGTAPGGAAVPGAEHCNDWTIESDEVLGYFGRSTEVDSNWLYWSYDVTNPTVCYDMFAIYCVEQP